MLLKINVLKGKAYYNIITEIKKILLESYQIY